jgi:hypothetical protein
MHDAALPGMVCNVNVCPCVVHPHDYTLTVAQNPENHWSHTSASVNMRVLKTVTSPNSKSHAQDTPVQIIIVQLLPEDMFEMLPGDTNPWPW